MEKIKKISEKNRYMSMLLVMTVVLLVFFTATKGKILWTPGTWKSIVEQFPAYGVMTLGVMFCFIIGNIDMSFVMLADFATIMGVFYMQSQVREGMTNSEILRVIGVAILIVLLIGAVGGFINGVLIAYLNIPPVMATIAMQLVWLGLSTALTQGDTQKCDEVLTLYSSIGHAKVFGFLPLPTLVFLIMFVFCAVLLKYTVYGKKLYMVGTNIKASRFSAINTKRMVIGTFMLCDVLCCIGGLLMVSTYKSAKADYGQSYTMTVILILVLAGVLPDGGMGKISNVLLSIVVIQLISTGVNMFPQLNTYYANLIWGALLIAVLILGTFLNGNSLKIRKTKKAAS